MEDYKRIWISWERHRRTQVLSDHFKCQLYEVTSPKKGLVRYLHSIIMTYKILRYEKPSVLIVQNPSMLLAFFSVLIKPAFRYTLIVDRHTNFKFNYRGVKSLKWQLFFCMSRFTLRNADVTVVTNRGLARIVKSLGGEPFVLQDKLPKIERSKRTTSQIDHHIKNYLFVCSFGNDEPVESVIDAFSCFSNDNRLYITGSWNKLYSREQIDRLPSNVVFTGFVSDEDFVKLMEDVDGVVVLTKNEFTLNCGAYEALSLNKPLLLSNTIALRQYFKGLAAFSGLKNKHEIMEGIEQLKKMEAMPPDNRKQLIDELHSSWLRRAEDLNDIMSRRK